MDVEGGPTVRDRLRPRSSPDQAISSIVAEILMVALALALAAGAWLFFSGFFSIAGAEDIPDDAVSATTTDLDGDKHDDWIRLTLVKAGDTSFDSDRVSVSISRGGTGTSYTASASTPILCTEAVATAGTGDQPPAVCDTASRNFHEGADQRWGEGGVLYVPCQGEETTLVTVTLDDTTVLDTRLACGQAAT